MIRKDKHVQYNELEEYVNSKIQSLYPVGKIIMSLENVNPATYLGFGTWELVDSGTYICAGTNSTEVTGVKIAGKSKTLTSSNIPSLTLDKITGRFDLRSYDGKRAEYTSTIVDGVTFKKDGSTSYQKVFECTSQANQTALNGINFEATPKYSNNSPTAINSTDLEPQHLNCYIFKRSA